MSDISRPPNNGKIFTRKLINTITQSKKNAVYSSSQQERGDLGMMVPKVFLRAREKFAKELVSNRNEKIVLLDDDETV